MKKKIDFYCIDCGIYCGRNKERCSKCISAFKRKLYNEKKKLNSRKVSK